jgi:DNA end-binding protein Ku
MVARVSRPSSSRSEPMSLVNIELHYAVGAKPRPRGENVVDLMDALKRSIATRSTAPKGKKPRKAAARQKEMLLPIEGKKSAAKKAVKPERSTGRRKAG